MSGQNKFGIIHNHKSSFQIIQKIIGTQNQFRPIATCRSQVQAEKLLKLLNQEEKQND